MPYSYENSSPLGTMPSYCVEEKVAYVGVGGDGKCILAFYFYFGWEVDAWCYYLESWALFYEGLYSSPASGRADGVGGAD